MVRRLFRRGEGGPEVIVDHAGRRVELTDERWRHIVEGHRELDGLRLNVEGHRELDGLRLAIRRTVERSDAKEPGKRRGTEVLYGRNLGPTRWLAVVLAYEDDRGWIVTAYPQTREPEASR